MIPLVRGYQIFCCTVGMLVGSESFDANRWSSRRVQVDWTALNRPAPCCTIENPANYKALKYYWENFLWQTIQRIQLLPCRVQYYLLLILFSPAISLPIMPITKHSTAFSESKIIFFFNADNCVLFSIFKVIYNF